MWPLVGEVLGPRLFPKMIKYFVKKKIKKKTGENEGSRDLLISILSYDEVSAFLLWMKARN